MTNNGWECPDFEVVRGEYMTLTYRHPDGRAEPYSPCITCLVRYPDWWKRRD